MPARRAEAGHTPRTPIAVVGMAGRFPGAADPDELWHVVRAGAETISRIAPDDHESADVLDAPGYVPAAGLLDDVAAFDADFFGIGAGEARLIDPQHRMLLECAWSALEDAACVPGRFAGRIGVFAGVGTSAYHQLDSTPYTPSLDRPEDISRTIAWDKDFAATRIAHRLDLRGPALTVQTACSTSLVAVHLAVRSIQVGDCEAALAGGCSIRVPQRIGYLHHAGGILSPDGHCRPFSARARGTVPGSGGGMVLLMPLAEAVRRGIPIHAVIRGSAVNNDGNVKLSYTAPSIAGQAEVIEAALRDGGVDPSAIGYLEAHGTGTELGDVVEIAGASRALKGALPGGCALGSIKANIGHLDVGAGIAGLIKCALALRHRVIPPALHADPVSAELDRAGHPFRLPDRAEEWHSDTGPRRAGVSSFGMGGTNAHVVLEEPPRPGAACEDTGPRLIVVSARSRSGVEGLTSALGTVVDEVPLCSLATTLSTGRAEHPYRWSAVVRDHDEARNALSGATGMSETPPTAPRVGYLCTGLGVRVGRAMDLYGRDAVFTGTFDRCREVVRDAIGEDIAVAWRDADTDDLSAMRMTIVVPTLFAAEMAVAAVLRSWGVTPDYLLGHSLGEWVAACVAGVTDLEHGTRVALARGTLMDRTPAGRMLSVALPADRVRPLLPPATTVAAEIGPDRSVLTGPVDEIERLAGLLTRDGIDHRLVAVNRALHSRALDQVLPEWRAVLAATPLRSPTTPWPSNVTGTWITPEEAGDPDYWVRQFRDPVLMDADLAALGAAKPDVLVEIGPERTLCGWAAQHPGISADVDGLAALGGTRSSRTAPEHLLATAGRLWQAGVPIDLAAVDVHRGPYARLPTYPFARTRHWLAGAADGVAMRPRPPRDDEARADEDSLCALWTRVLGTRPSSEDADFFELGGDSLLALQLASAIRRETGLSATPQDILTAPTLGGLRARLASIERNASTRHLHRIPVRAQQPPAGPPLYVVHPIGGTTIAYRELAARLAPRSAVWAFAATGTSGAGQRPPDITKMARAYVRELLETHAEDTPFWLAGWSFGGVVAFEMARLLADAGRAPVLTALLDSPWPAPTADYTRAPAGDSSDQADLIAAHLDALRRHRISPGPQPRPVVYVRAGDEPVDDEIRWRDAVPDLIVRTSPGSHFTMVEAPQVGELASTLELCLEDIATREVGKGTGPQWRHRPRECSVPRSRTSASAGSEDMGSTRPARDRR